MTRRAAPELVSPAHGQQRKNASRPCFPSRTATDPDSDTLAYDFEIYSSGALVQSAYA